MDEETKEYSKENRHAISYFGSVIESKCKIHYENCNDPIIEKVSIYGAKQRACEEAWKSVNHELWKTINRK